MEHIPYSARRRTATTVSNTRHARVGGVVSAVMGGPTMSSAPQRYTEARMSSVRQRKEAITSAMRLAAGLVARARIATTARRTNTVAGRKTAPRLEAGRQ